MPRIRLLLALAAAPVLTAAPAAAQAKLEPFAIEYTYKVKWGYFDEFLALYRKNHLPILRKLQEKGVILSMTATYPLNHSPEASRWDFRYTIVYRDVVAAHETDSPEFIASLFPDQVTFKREEQRRFELLLEHTDVPVRVENVKDWK